MEFCAVIMGWRSAPVRPTGMAPGWAAGTDIVVDSHAKPHNDGCTAYSL